MMKEEELPPFNFPIEDKSERIIKVIGVGGGGGNAVQHMWEEGVKNVSFVVTNTDSQALVPNKVPSKIQLGDGLGAGGDPEMGRKKAEESMDAIMAMLDENTKMVFITAGMGGGTGTGAAPVIARAAKEKGILTVGVVTLPFKMEGKKRIDIALKGMERMRQSVDSLIVINNEKLLEDERFVEMDWEEGMKKADEVLTTATKTIAEIITKRGKVNRDFNDVNTVMKNGGAAIVSIAKASGEKRILKAMSEALNSPLVANVDKQRTKRLLYIVYSGQKNPAKIAELKEINEFMEGFDENIEVLWGHYQDDTLEDDIKVAIVATGFDPAESQTESERDEANELEHVQHLRQKYYASSVEPEEKKEVNPTEETPFEPVEATTDEVETMTEEVERIDAPEEEFKPKSPSFMKIMMEKLKVLMEEE